MCLKSRSSKGIRLFVMCLKSRSSTGTLGKRVLPLRGNSMLMVHIGSLSSTPKPHGLLQRDLQLIHLIYLVIHVNLLILLMSHLTPNYKLFKNQNGEVFARYVGTNCRNGSPMK